jgi:hypothetical protein
LSSQPDRPTPALSDLISTLQSQAGLEKPRSHPPVHLWNPPHCGDIGLEIRKDGSWWQEGVRFTREKLVRLFSTILRKDDDGYYLVTPHEKVAIRVEDAPFVGIRIDTHDGPEGVVRLVTTNVGDTVPIGADHPLRVTGEDSASGPGVYVLIRGGLEARLSRPAYYELVEAAEAGEAGEMAIVSMGRRFRIGRAD